MKRVDANVILRYLLEDHAEFSERATVIMESEIVLISFEVICEVIYVLGGVYGVDREVISGKLNDLIQFGNVETLDTEVLARALRVFAEENVDFVDAILCAYHHVRGDQVYSFDKKMNRLMGV